MMASGFIRRKLTQESGTVTISGNHAGIAGKPDLDEESANFALYPNGGTLICNLIEPVVDSGLVLRVFLERETLDLRKEGVR